MAGLFHGMNEPENGLNVPGKGFKKHFFLFSTPIPGSCKARNQTVPKNNGIPGLEREVGVKDGHYAPRRGCGEARTSDGDYGFHVKNQTSSQSY